MVDVIMKCIDMYLAFVLNPSLLELNET
jgi:hypothetical protein